MFTECSTYGPLAVSIFGAGIPPGELISCALLALLVGVWKSAFLLTVLPLIPFNALGRGVLGTNPSSLCQISLSHGSCRMRTPTYRTYLHPLPSALVGTA
jgi:hypothetical protein